MRATEDDVVLLPLPWSPCWIHERRILTVDRSRLPIGIGVVLVRIEHLQLIYPHQEDSTVPALLAFAFHHRRRGPLDVQLHVAKTARRLDHAGARLYFHVAVLHGPLGRGAVLRPPLRQVFPVE